MIASAKARDIPIKVSYFRTRGGYEVDLILDGGPTRVGIESTVLSLARSKPMLLRPGMISREQIEERLLGVQPRDDERPRPEPLAPADQPALERVTAAAFGQRRKMLRTSLKTLGVPVEPLLDRAGVAPTARAEELTVAEFCAIARVIGSR